MKFTALPLSGAFAIDLDKRVDDRGYFARTFCVNEFTAHGLIANYVQMSTSYNHSAGQIRGMHYQDGPHEETKIVRCTRGSIYDVMVDLRPQSPTYRQFYGGVLSADNGRMFYIPKGFAHGYKVLVDETEIFYMMDEFYHPELAREILPADLGISWESK